MKTTPKLKSVLAVRLVAMAGDRDRSRSTSRGVTRSRRKADAMAKELLQSRTGIVDAHITRLLDAWRFKPNFARKNITPDGAPFCHSDTIGLVLSRDGRVVATKAARNFPNFLSVLCRWLKEHGKLDRPFCFTSICLNQGFAPALHRDVNNYGTSITKAFGKFFVFAHVMPCCYVCDYFA